MQTGLFFGGNRNGATKGEIWLIFIFFISSPLTILKKNK
ncbi:MAG: hypothetical protein ACJATF_000719 [Flavobacteriales bacterium]|jgi:hypothetical protein